jgi:hypothetical protein
MYILIFSAQGEYIFFPNPLASFTSFTHIIYFGVLINFLICSVIFGMLIALPITLVYYILLGI